MADPCTLKVQIMVLLTYRKSSSRHLTLTQPQDCFSLLQSKHDVTIRAHRSFGYTTNYEYYYHTKHVWNHVKERIAKHMFEIWVFPLKFCKTPEPRL